MRGLPGGNPGLGEFAHLGQGAGQLHRTSSDASGLSIRLERSPGRQGRHSPFFANQEYIRDRRRRRDFRTSARPIHIRPLSSTNREQNNSKTNPFFYGRKK